MLFSPELIFWLKGAISIFFLSFLHEDAAIVSSGFLYVEKGFPFLWSYLPVYTGLISGDFIIYSLGYMAQKNRRLRSKIVGPKVESLKSGIDRHLVKVLILCRFVPVGLLFPTFVSCGWFRIPFRRFAAVSLIFGAIYSFTMISLVILFGDLVIPRIGRWAWIFPVLLLGTPALIRYFKSKKKESQSENSRATAFSLFKTSKRFNLSGSSEFVGMPSPFASEKVVSPAEAIPNRYLYIPMIISWLFHSVRYRSLTLPSVSNPYIETGGFMGESKSSVMDMVGKDKKCWLAQYATLDHKGEDPDSEFREALYLMESKDIDFPVVAKPDIGSNGMGVNLIGDNNQLKEYIRLFPAGEKIILQKLVRYDGEAGIFYVRIPGEEYGYIYSVTLRYYPFVTGDGTTTLSDLIQNDRRARGRKDFYLNGNSMHKGCDPELIESIPGKGELVRLSFIGSLRTGGLYRNGNDIITPELTNSFDEIARSMKEFNYGRFDIRFESVDLLKKGKGFSIIEINGCGAEAIHAWDPETSVTGLYSEFFRAQSLLFRIGAINRSRGFRPMPVVDFIKAIRRQRRLIRKYPPSC